jgi:phenylacetate-CoA ligase
MRHAHRTAGFWKVRGMNINHAEMEDLVFRVPAVNDFRVEARTGDALEHVWVGIEVSADVEGAQVAGELGQQIKAVFEVTAEIEVLETGTLAAEFETTVKAARFVDQRV